MTRAYRFDRFRMDLVKHHVTGPDGAVLAIASRAYEALLYLIENRARLVAKDDLLKAVWPRAVVEENNLNQAISALRRALGDTRGAPRIIVTVPGRGYRFVAEVQVETGEEPSPAQPIPDVPGPDVSITETPGSDMSAPPASAGQIEVPTELDVALRHAHSSASPAPEPPSPAVASPARRQVLAVLGGTAALAAAAAYVWWLRRPPGQSRMPQSIAVLPFKPLVEEAGDEALEFGIAETLINRLSGLPGVTVTPLSSARRFAGADQDPVAAGRALAVAAVIEGHVQFQPDRIRLTARLLDVRDGSALWTGSFDEQSHDFFAVQDSLASQLVEALSVDLSDEARRRLVKHYTEDIEAWQLYLNGRYHWDRKTEDGLSKAIQYYTAAENRDPRFALPAAGLADAWAVFGVFGILPPGVAFPRARQAALRAIALDSQLAEAQASLGHVQVQQSRDWTDGERLYRLALKLKPTYAQAVMWIANNHVFQNRIPEALVEAQQAQSLEPMSLSIAANVGMVQTFAGNYDAAIAQLVGLVDAAPQAVLARNHLARAYCLRGEPRNAIQVLEGYPQPAPGSFSNLGRAYALAGQVQAAQREIERVEALGARDFGVGYDLALIHAALGNATAALDALERGVSDGSQTIGFLNCDPGLDSIRDDARFRAVLRQLGLG
jgi:DNA-binding winged helix-turn-helix (wHTH) protein/TolB-like protein/Flp pilus assembly protein TadD